MPFQLPGQMRGPDGPEAQAEEAEEITQEKINELLEKYGGGPPKKDNLPIPLRPGIRVTTGPNWMWRMNGVEENEQGQGHWTGFEISWLSCMENTVVSFLIMRHSNN